MILCLSNLGSLENNVHTLAPPQGSEIRKDGTEAWPLVLLNLHGKASKINGGMRMEGEDWCEGLPQHMLLLQRLCERNKSTLFR